tara:strand:- start:14624 stop:15520 length:897 start_codon:yes stop_codon:yes gene_type:complete
MAPTETLSPKAVADIWYKKSIGTGTTDEQRRIAERGYRAHYEDNGIEWPGKVYFFRSPMAAARACARAYAESEDIDYCVAYGEVWSRHMGGRMWPTWPAYIDYAKQFPNDHPPSCDAILDQAECGWWWPTDEGVWASDNPVEYHCDEDRMPHNEHGPAIKWADGDAIYAIHSVVIEGRFIEDRSTITLDVIAEARNMELRRVLRELYGNARYLHDTGAEVLDMDQVPTVLARPSDYPWIQRALMRDRDGNRWLMTGDGSTEDVYCIPVEKTTATCAAGYDALRAHRVRGKTIKTILEC